MLLKSHTKKIKRQLWIYSWGISLFRDLVGEKESENGEEAVSKERRK